MRRWKRSENKWRATRWCSTAWSTECLPYWNFKFSVLSSFLLLIRLSFSQSWVRNLWKFQRKSSDKYSWLFSLPLRCIHNSFSKFCIKIIIENYLLVFINWLILKLIMKIFFNWIYQFKFIPYLYNTTYRLFVGNFIGHAEWFALSGKGILFESFLLNIGQNIDYLDWRFSWFSSVPPGKFLRSTRICI